MKQLTGYILIALMLVACGPESGRFRLEGRLRNMHQGEFYVYSPDGGIVGTDTIPVREGRFAYETALREPATLVVIFPNFSEQAVFGKPGAKVTVKGDASNMKEMTISGTEENEQMTKLRMELNRLMPPEIPKAVEAYIREHLTSPVSIYLLRRYFILSREPDYSRAYTLAQDMLKADPENGQLMNLKKQLESLSNGSVKSQLPRFSATDVKGKTVTEASLKARVNVVSAWASWSYQSTDMQRRLKQLKEKHGNQLAIVSICLDGRPDDCRRTVVTRDSLKWPTVCDGRMWQTPLLAKLGIATIPANLVVDDKGRILERNLKPQQLEEKINDLLK